jgi:hypothetical protein
MADESKEILTLEYEAQTAEAAERLRFATDFAQSGLKALFLANGGAMVALFTLIGNHGALKPDTTLIWWSFAAFVAGLVFALLSSLGAHISQNLYYILAQAIAWNARDQVHGGPAGHDLERPYNLGTIAQRGATVAAIVSLAGFAAGAGLALAAVMP